MALTKKEKQEVAEMIARGVAAADTAADAGDIETAAKEPEMGSIRHVTSVQIATYLNPSPSGLPKPDTGTTVEATIYGQVNKEGGKMNFLFPPGDSTILRELIRLQSFPRSRFPSVRISFIKPERDPHSHFIFKLSIHSLGEPVQLGHPSHDSGIDRAGDGARMDVA